MRRLRVVMIFVLSAVIAYGIWKYYTVNQNIYFQDPVAPARERLTQELDLESLDQQQGETAGFFAKLKSLLPTRGATLPRSNKLHPEFTTGQLAMSDVLKLTRGAKTDGDLNGRFLMLEYCDFASEYCQEGAQNNIYTTYADYVSGDMAYQFRSYPPQSNDGAMSPHMALACADQRGTVDQYFDFVQGLYALESYRLSDYQAIAQEAGIVNYTSCLLKQNSNIKIRQQMKLADELFGITALPTYIFVDKHTGIYTKVPGLYQDKYVYTALDKLSGE